MFVATTGLLDGGGAGELLDGGAGELLDDGAVNIPLPVLDGGAEGETSFPTCFGFGATGGFGLGLLIASWTSIFLSWSFNWATELPSTSNCLGFALTKGLGADGLVGAGGLLADGFGDGGLLANEAGADKFSSTCEVDLAPSSTLALLKAISSAKFGATGAASRAGSGTGTVGSL